VQHDQKLWLAAQDDLQKLFLVRVRVTQQANLFQQLGGEQMRLVYQ